MNTRKIIYSILKEVQKGEQEPKAEDFGISQKEFVQIAEMMQDKELIKNAAFAKSAGVNSMVWLKNANITFEGLEYLEQNNAWAKTYKGLKEIKEWLSL